MEEDAVLVQHVLAGDTAAYGDLVRRHERALVAAAAAVLGNLDSAQDAAQEAFLLAHRRLGTLRNSDVFGAWAVRIAQRVALRMRSRRDKAGPLCSDTAAAPSPDSRLDEDIRQVLRKVLQLPERQRQVVLLRYFSGFDLDAIAQITDQRQGAVRTQLSRAVTRLRQQLKDSQP